MPEESHGWTEAPETSIGIGIDIGKFGLGKKVSVKILVSSRSGACMPEDGDGWTEAPEASSRPPSAAVPVCPTSPPANLNPPNLLTTSNFAPYY